MSSESQDQECTSESLSNESVTLPQLPVLIEKLKYVVMGLSLLDAARPKGVRPDSSEKPEIEQGEFRTYYFSPFTLKNERELLEKYQEESFHGLLEEAALRLGAFTELLLHIDEEKSLDGCVVRILGRELERTRDMLDAMRDTYSTLFSVGEADFSSEEKDE